MGMKTPYDPIPLGDEQDQSLMPERSELAACLIERLVVDARRMIIEAEETIARATRWLEGQRR